VIGWVAAALLAWLSLPKLQDAGRIPLSSLVPKDSEAVEVADKSRRYFSVPLVTQSAVVQRDPQGLSVEAQARVAERALAISTAGDPQLKAIQLALPLTNTLDLFPSSKEDSTTAITFLAISPEESLADQENLAHLYAAKYVTDPDDALVGVTGAVPARMAEWRAIEDALPWVTLATVGVIALILGLYLRALVAPLVTLVAAGIAYLVAIGVVSWVGENTGADIPSDVEPVLIVLLLGITTDYAVFFLSGMRRRVLAGHRRLDAAKGSTVEFLPIVTTAGLIVAAGTACLSAGELRFFRAFGPGLALTVLVTLAVALTFIPAGLAILGRRLFWPSLPEPGRNSALETEFRRARREFWGGIARVAAAKPIALVIVVGCLVAVGFASKSLADINLGFTSIAGLPADSEPKRAAEAAGRGFARGILAPTELLVEQRGDVDLEALARLERAVAEQPGVAAVVGPDDEPARVIPDLVVSERAPAARFLVVFDEDPLGSAAIDYLEDLRDAMPGLLEEAGIPEAEVGFGGETALAEETVRTLVHDLARIGLAVLLVNLVLLVIFLRALVAPLYLLAASALALASSLGLTTWVFQSLLGYGELTYYVPFAVAVLLLSLGSDYNVFIVGRVWHEAARRHSVRDAVAAGAARASGAITVAGLALAFSFATLAIIPLRQFREFAFAMFVGVLLDAFLVRSLLVPGLISVFGEASWWPASREVVQPVAETADGVSSASDDRTRSAKSRASSLGG
jgi:RND superfamily putative drug exporter